jgi:hypothetical protein
MAAEYTVAINGQEFCYTPRPEDGTYRFQIDGRAYGFRQWTWGEKNRVTDAATIVDTSSGRLRLDIGRFNELMLLASLVDTEPAMSITLDTLRGLHPVLGDTLLSIAYWVNELPASEKKT